jgi:hypothetical protein
MVPVFGLGGEIQGFQARDLSGAAENKYIWISGGKGGNSIHNSFGETPLQVIPGNEEPRTIVFVEGALKPLNIWLMLEGVYTVVGAIGGNWTSSPKTLDQIIQHLRLDGSRIGTVILPDAGWRVNSHVTPKVVALVDYLKRKHGLTPEIAYWGHWDDKTQPDPDEIPASRLQVELAFTSAERVPNPTPRKLPVVQLLQQSWKAPLTYDGGLHSHYDVDLDENPDGIFDLLSKSKVVLDCSPVGRGKTFSVERLHKSGLYDRVIYVSQSPRNPATAYLEEHAYRPPTRHDGLVDTGLKTPLGKPVLRRPKTAQETVSTFGTCSQHTEHLVALKTGLDAKQICEGCPFFSVCVTGEDPNNNYLYLNKLRGKADLSLISTSSHGLSDWMFEDARVLLIVDEPSQSMPVYESTYVTAAEMNVLQAELAGSWTRTEGRLSYHPLDEVAERSLMRAKDEAQAARIRAWSKSGKRGPQPPTPKNVAVFNALTRGGLLERGGVWSGTCPHTRNLSFVDKATSVLFLDATASPDILKAEWGLNDILTAGCPDKSVDRVVVRVLQCEGFNSNSWHTQERSMTIAKEAMQSYPTYGVITHGKSGIKGSLTYFSTSRGSNLFKDRDGLIMLGLPQINLGAAQEQYANLVKPSFSFDAYYKHLVEAEVIQSIGRLRAQRRDQQFEVIVLANVSFNGLIDRGFRVTYEAAAETLVSAQDLHARMVLRLIDAIKSGVRGTQNYVAKAISANSGSLSKCLSRINMTIGELFEFFDALSSPTPVWATLSEEATQDILRCGGCPIQLQPETQREILPLVGCVGAKGIPRRIWSLLSKTIVISLSDNLARGAYWGEALKLDQAFGGWDSNFHIVQRANLF